MSSEIKASKLKSILCLISYLGVIMRKKFIIFLTVFLEFIFCNYSFSESIVCAYDTCPKKLDHIEYSVSEFPVILVGKFYFENKNFAGKSGEDKAFFNLIFKPELVLKGDVSVNPVVYRLNLQRPYFILGKNNFNAVDVFFMWKRVMSISDPSESRKSYENLEMFFSGYGRYGAYTSNDVALVPVSPGTLDSSVRSALVPIFQGQRYVVFLGAEMKNDPVIIFEDDVNIYPFDIFKRLPISKKFQIEINKLQPH